MAAPDPNLDSPADNPPKGAPWKPMLLVAIATAVLILLVPTEDERVVDLPPAPSATTPEPAAHSPAPQADADAAAGSLARGLIAKQRSNGTPDPEAAYEEARRQEQAGRLEDAYVLDYYAATLGHAGAALHLGRQADPAHWQAGGPMSAAAPWQALKWYREAERAGHPEAEKHLAALKRWAEQAAKAGDAQAQRLMLAWQ